MTWAGFAPSGSIWTTSGPGTLSWASPSGDAIGSLDGLIVIGLRGRNISPLAPISGYVLYYDGNDWVPTSPVVLSGIGGGGGTTSHNLLSITHPDTLPGTPVAGDIIAASGISTVWAQIPIGNPGAVLTVNSTASLPTWSFGAMQILQGLGNWNLLVNTVKKVIVRQSGSAGTLVLPPNPHLGQEIIVKDGLGNASLFNTHIYGSGHTIDGLSSIRISQNYQAWNLTWTGLEWSIL